MSDHLLIQAPVSESEAIELGRTTFRKQILRKGQFEYKGRTLDFDDAYCAGLASAYRDGAFDEVPLVFAPADNSHTQAVERVRGSIIGMEDTADGLDAIVRFDNEKDAELVRKHPRLGVSPRIEQHLARSDGKAWPAAVQHVLATTNPRIPGMREWEPVDLSVPDGVEVVDLSTAQYAAGPDGAPADNGDHGKEQEMSDTTPVSPFTEDELAALRGLLAKAADQGNPNEAPDDGLPSDEELDALAARLLAEEEGELIEASNVDSEAIELAVRQHPMVIELAAQKDQMASRLRALETERDAARFEALKSELATEHGVPPFVVDLAKPLLTGSHVIELSQGSKVDAGEVVLKVIKAMAEANTLDLSKAVYPTSQPDPAENADSRQQEINNYAARHGLS